MTLRTDKPSNQIRGGEVGTMTLTITNIGTAPAYRVRAESTSDYGYFDERELLFGKLEPGETRTAELKLSVAAHELSRTDRIDFQVRSERDAALSPDSTTSIDVAAIGIARPKFAFGYQVVDDPSLKGVTGNGDGLLQVGERVRLRVWVENVGPGLAQDARVQLRNGSGEAVFLHSGRENLKTVAPGDSRVVEFDLEVKKPTEDGLIKLQLAVADAKIGASLAEKLSFPLAASTVTFAAGSGNVLAGGPIDLYASPLAEQQQKVARAEAGSALKVLGVADGWYRVELDSKRFAFARASDVKPGGAGKAKLSEVLAVSPPKISLGRRGDPDQQRPRAHQRHGDRRRGSTRRVHQRLQPGPQPVRQPGEGVLPGRRGPQDGPPRVRRRRRADARQQHHRDPRARDG